MVSPKPRAPDRSHRHSSAPARSQVVPWAVSSGICMRRRKGVTDALVISTSGSQHDAQRQEHGKAQGELCGLGEGLVEAGAVLLGVKRSMED